MYRQDKSEGKPSDFLVHNTHQLIYWQAYAHAS